ncbi:MAG: hypothetical protein Q9181_006196 [Wetmoreana brouardii]
MGFPKVVKILMRWYLENIPVLLPNFTREDYETTRQSHIPLVTFILCYCLPDTAARSARIQRVILGGKDDDVLYLRQAVTDECNLTAVARTIGQLYNPGLIKDWLSRPPDESEGSGSTPRVSLAAAFILSAPFNMMRASICSFLVGLAIYQGFTWTRSLDKNAGPEDSRNVFIAFMVGAGACVFFYMYSFSSKTYENKLRSGFQLEILSRGGEREAGHAPNAQQHMDNDPAPVGLSAALEAAAQAHLQCAEAESRVALEYSRASHTEHNYKEEGGLPQNERSEPGP